MQNQRQPSPMLIAIDLLRMDIDAMTLDDLEDHARQVLDTLAALNDYINGHGFKSADAMTNAMRLTKKLVLHMARLRDLIQASKSMQAMAQNVQSQSSLSLIKGMHAMGRRSRVIRPALSADNAASGPSAISGNEPSARDSKSLKGGEAKEAPTRPQSGEASLQAKR
jgi:hypothetical protein